MLSVNTSMFLDRSKVFKALDRKRQVVLLRTGGYTRTIMRNSMKRAKKGPGGGSKPGQPPRYRIGTLRNKIAFGFDPRTESVVVGTENFRTKTKPAGGKTTAELINEGGTARITTPAGVTRASYAPRPFTPPAEAAGAVFFNDLIESTPLK